VLRRIRPPLAIGAGFLIGLVLAALDKLLVPLHSRDPLLRAAVEAIDWIAPPLAGALLGGAVLYALRHQRLAEAERAASQVLAERLMGTERRQALWVVAASVAHDLKNPLHNLQLLVEDLGEETDAGRRAELLARVRENLTRATARIHELAEVGFSPADDGSSLLELAPVMEELRQRLLPKADAARTSLRVECPRGLNVRLNAIALRSALEHVAANALEALQTAGAGGSVAVRAQAVSGGALEIVVEDDGPGIPEPVRQRLFVPFAASRSGTTGLGLAIARALARAGGGELVLADSAPGRTRFRFTFPGAGVSPILDGGRPSA